MNGVCIQLSQSLNIQVKGSSNGRFTYWSYWEYNKLCIAAVNNTHIAGYIYNTIYQIFDFLFYSKIQHSFHMNGYWQSFWNRIKTLCSLTQHLHNLAFHCELLDIRAFVYVHDSSLCVEEYTTNCCTNKTDHHSFNLFIVVLNKCTVESGAAMTVQCTLGK